MRPCRLLEQAVATVTPDPSSLATAATARRVFGPQKSKCNAILPKKALTISDSTDKWLNFLIFLSQHYISLHTRSLRSGNFSKIRGSDARQLQRARFLAVPSVKGPFADY